MQRAPKHSNISAISPLPPLRPDLPARQGCQHKRRVHPIEGGIRRRRRLGHVTRGLCAAGLRCRCSHQCHEHPKLQGCRLSRSLIFLATSAPTVSFHLSSFLLPRAYSGCVVKRLRQLSNGGRQLNPTGNMNLRAHTTSL